MYGGDQSATTAGVDVVNDVIDDATEDHDHEDIISKRNCIIASYVISASCHLLDSLCYLPYTHSPF